MWLAAVGTVVIVLAEALHPDPLTGGLANPVGIDMEGVLNGDSA